MPSAARPFSKRVVDGLIEHGIEIATITLHCGVASLEEPERPAAERYHVPVETAEAVNHARAQGRRVIAVGSTALRALESSFYGGDIIASSGWTDLVIGDRHTVRTVEGVLTGFHDTAATHQSILRAFLGRGLLASAYAEAADAGYYQHEFGDVHLIL
jgi:S-adenosylmethionine:tRNA ribosyltransferase-isomerase